MPYKIGEVSRILNIPIDTIRFYQKQGIVRPKRNEENGYHYFDADDLDTLLYYKKHRALEFSAREIGEIMTADSSETYLRRCEEKHKEIERRLKWYSLLLRKNQNYIDVLCAMPENIGRFTITEQPEAYYFVNNADDVFSMSEDVRALFNDWMAYYPFVENFYSIEPEALSGGDADFHFHRGFTIKRMWADVLPVLFNDSARRIPKRPAVYTVVRTANSRVFTAGLFAGALDFISANGLRVCDAIQGNVLTCVHEDGQTVRYMEVWLPVGPKDGEL